MLFFVFCGITLQCCDGVRSNIPHLDPFQHPVRAEEPKGQGGDLSFAECDRSVEGKAPCGVNDTVFVNGRTGAKGGSVSLSGSEDPSTVEFHRCSVENSSAGFDFKDDPQGEGGAFSVGEGVTLVLSDCLVEECSCGKKVRFRRGLAKHARVSWDFFM